MEIIIGIALIPLGGWIAYVNAKKLIDGESNFSGGLSDLLITGIGMLLCGIVLLMKHI